MKKKQTKKKEKRQIVEIHIYVHQDCSLPNTYQPYTPINPNPINPNYPICTC